VLLDIGLPGMDGYEVARQLRQDPQRAATVLVALTGYGQSSDRHQTRNAGFDQHLIKPVDTGVLRTLLTSIERRPR
jgi:two-component system CheB/CheR fusion protein